MHIIWKMNGHTITKRNKDKGTYVWPFNNFQIIIACIPPQYIIVMPGHPQINKDKKNLMAWHHDNDIVAVFYLS